MFSPTFPDLQGLVSLADTSGIDIRPTLLRVLTDLYVQKPSHSVDEERHYVELATRLIDVVDAGTREIIGGKLAGYTRAPQPVLQRLAHSAPADSPVAWTVPPSVTQNALPAPSSSAPAPLSTLASAPARKLHPARELSELFFAADAQERGLILLNLDYATLAPAASLDVAHAAEAIRRLERTALARKPNAFMTVLEQFLSISKGYAARLVEDRTGESVLVAAKALGMPAETFQRIILFLNPAIGQSVQRVFDLAQLYDEVTRESALRVLALWHAAEAPASRPAVYRPVHFNDESPRARDMTTHAARRTGVRIVEADRTTRRRDPA